MILYWTVQLEHLSNLTVKNNSYFVSFEHLPVGFDSTLMASYCWQCQQNNLILFYLSILSNVVVNTNLL